MSSISPYISTPGPELPPDAGPRIVAIGGGTGLSTMLRGLKRCSRRITAIVAVTDDGGGSGRLRQDLDMPPPGDIRNCIQALANAEPVLTDLLNYRFPEGTLAGQSFGNLFLAALNGISPSFDQAVARMSQVLAITGQVLPVTNANVNLEALFENGARIVGESRISDFKTAQNCRINRVRLLPPHCAPLPEALHAIAQADLILLGPGSLYTSIIPNLLVDGISQQIADSRALRIYICNIMTQAGETEGYTVSDHLAALLQHGNRNLVDICLANSTPVPAFLLEQYRAENASPIPVDLRECQALGVELITRPLRDTQRLSSVRHDPDALARTVLELLTERSVRVCREDRAAYVRER